MYLKILKKIMLIYSSSFFFLIFDFIFICSVRVSNELGRGSAKAAKFSVFVIVATSFSIGIVLFVLFLLFRGSVAYVFTKDPRVAKAVDYLSLLLAFTILLNSVQPVLSGN